MRIILWVCVALTIGCGTRTGPQVTAVGTTAERVIQIQQAATTAALAVETLIISKAITPQEADSVLLAIRGVGQGGVALADALEAYRLARTPEARQHVTAIVNQLTSAMMQGILIIPDQTKQQAVWARIQPLFTTLTTLGLSLVPLL